MMLFLLALILNFPGPSVPDGAVRPVNLRTEYRVDPLGVDEQQPRLSWMLEAEGRGRKQTAYRVMVASSAGALDMDRGDVWDSGKVSSDENHLVPVAGVELEPGRTYYWKVRVWDETDSPSGWSARAAWTTGRLGQWDAASWMGLDSTAFRQLGMKPDQLPLFRRRFDLGKPVRRALVHVSGVGFYELYLNGSRVSDDVLQPGWTDYAESVLYNTYDVTEALRQGENVLGVGLGYGMYHVPGSGANGRFAKFFDSFGAPRFVVYLSVEHPDGTETIVTSDDRWRVSGGPTVFSSMWGGEDYDARLEQAAWAEPGFDDGRWQRAARMAPPGGTLRAQPIPPLKVQETYPTVNITEPRPGVYVYDFGQNLSGWPVLRVRGPAGATVRLLPSEVLGPDGSADQTSMKHWGVISFAYTLRGDGAETWHPSFTYTGFRYVQVEGATPDPAEAAERNLPLILDLSSRFIHADIERTGRFATSNDTLNGIHEIIIDAVRSNMMSVMTDCPHREKLGWLEQAYLHGPGILYNFGAATLYAKWTDDMAEAQTPEGLIPDIAPEYTVFQAGFRDSPEWGGAFILAPWVLYRFTGDLRPMERHYDRMKRYAAYLRSRMEDGLLQYGLGDWYDLAPPYDRPGPSKLTNLGVTATAVFIDVLRTLAKTAPLIGRAGEAAAFEEEAEHVRQTFLEAYLDPSTGRIDRGSQTAQAMPLAMGLVPPEAREQVFERLVTDIEGRGYHPTAGDIGHRYVLRALLEGGRSDLVYRMALNPEPPSYAAQLLAGTTTLTEDWAALPTSSQNHFMLGHIEEWFYEGLGGLRIEQPGFRRLRIEPQVVEGLEWVEVTYRSIHGEIRSAWKREGDQLTVDITTPPGVLADVVLPIQPGSIKESGMDITEARGVFAQPGAQRGTALHLVSGTYRFTGALVAGR